MFVMKPPIGQGESQVIFCEPLWIQAMNRTFIWQSQNTWTSFLLSTGLSCPLSDFFFFFPFYLLFHFMSLSLFLTLCNSVKTLAQSSQWPPCRYWQAVLSFPKFFSFPALKQPRSICLFSNGKCSSTQPSMIKEIKAVSCRNYFPCFFNSLGLCFRKKKKNIF